MRTIREAGVRTPRRVVWAGVRLVARVASASSCALLAACGDSGSPRTTTNFACSACGDAGARALGPEAGGDPLLASSHDANPDGVPYPSPAGGYGHNARKLKTPGSVIGNFKFFGYPSADESKGLQTVALADYYDPCGKRLRLLHLSVAAVWCVPCNEETIAFVAAKAQLDAKHVVLVQALSDGPTKNVPATTSDLKYWITANQSNFTEMLDPNLANFGVFFDAAAVPWNADIDPRTMEILDDGTGYAGSAAMELQPGITAAAEPPGYPIAVTCN